jgi:GNAT superfamily N-acetyltransferase
MIQLLPPERWHELEAIFADEWGACLPNPEHALIVVETEDDELIGFCILETLVRPGNFYVAPNHRGKTDTVRRLMGYIATRATRSGRSFVTFADEPRFERLFQRLHMRPVGTAWRKDFFD